MLYDTILLRTFAAVCDTGSFTKAAHLVNLTQSAVSLHVKRLEEQVGARLSGAARRASGRQSRAKFCSPMRGAFWRSIRRPSAAWAARTSGLSASARRNISISTSFLSLIRQFSGPKSGAASADRIGHRPRYCRAARSRRSRPCDPQPRDRRGRWHRALAREAHLGSRPGDAPRPGSASAAGALPAELPLASGRPRRTRPRRAALDRRAAKLRHRRHPRGAGCRACHHHLPREPPAAGAASAGPGRGAPGAAGF